MGTKTGRMGVDWEQRIDFDRLRSDRLARTRQAMEEHDLGALILFEPDMIRYVTGRFLGRAIAERLPTGYCVLCRGQEPILYGWIPETVWINEKNAMPWMGDRVKHAIHWNRGTFAERLVKSLAKDWMVQINEVIKAAGLEGSKVGFDVIDIFMMETLKDANFKVVDGRRPMWEARQIKTEEEIEIIKQAATIATAAFWDIWKALRPGIRECELMGVSAKTLHSLGSEHVDMLVASGPHTNPNFIRESDRIIDWGDLVFCDIAHQYLGYQTCYYRGFVCGGRPTQKQQDLLKECLDIQFAGINVIKDGASSADVVKAWNKSLPNDALWRGTFMCHGIGLTNGDMPCIWPELALKDPVELKENMVLAIETFAGEPGEEGGIRLEDMGVVTKTGFELITNFPYDLAPTYY